MKNGFTLTTLSNQNATYTKLKVRCRVTQASFCQKTGLIPQNWPAFSNTYLRNTSFSHIIKLEDSLPELGLFKKHVTVSVLLPSCPTYPSFNCSLRDRTKRPPGMAVLQSEVAGRRWREDGVLHKTKRPKTFVGRSQADIRHKAQKGTWKNRE